MSSALSLRELDPALCALRNDVLAARVEGINVTHLNSATTYVALSATSGQQVARVLIPLQQLVDFWLGEASLPAEQIDRDIALRFMEDAFQAQGLPSPGNLFQWQSVVGFATEQEALVPAIELRGEVFDVYLDKLPLELRAQAPLWPNLPVDTRWMFDTVVLEAIALTGLAVGDVICVPRAKGKMYAGNIPLFSFYLQDDFFMIEETNDQAAPDPDAGTAIPHLDFEALPVTVSFVLGNRTMTVADIAALYPGMTVSLDYVSPQIDVMAGGVVLAKGELVRIGEKIGVEINRITSAIGGAPVSSS